ncbi:MAG: hypothetical protein ACK49R_09585 [Planctomycetota bacterium]|jgi:hypothetical protein|nr:hypothetical protein [Blastopirellula sp.]
MKLFALPTLLFLLLPSLLSAQQPQVVREWLTVTPESARAEFLMPFAPQASERTLEPVKGQKITVKMQVADLDRKHTFVFSYHDQAPPKDDKAERDALDGAVKGAIASTLGALDKVSAIRSGNLNGREVTYTLVQGENNKMRVAARFFLDGGRLYQLTYVAADADFNSAHAKKFLESFKHLPQK